MDSGRDVEMCENLYRVHGNTKFYLLFMNSFPFLEQNWIHWLSASQIILSAFDGFDRLFCDFGIDFVEKEELAKDPVMS